VEYPENNPWMQDWKCSHLPLPTVYPSHTRFSIQMNTSPQLFPLSGQKYYLLPFSLPTSGLPHQNTRFLHITYNASSSVPRKSLHIRTLLPTDVQTVSHGLTTRRSHENLASSNSGGTNPKSSENVRRKSP
jgi:hypothetical protein